jgi:hypothetical protein
MPMLLEVFQKELSDLVPGQVNPPQGSDWI